jgi:hypothetical protein
LDYPLWRSWRHLSPTVAEGVVIVDNATEFDIAQIKSDLVPQVSLQDIFA